MKQNKTLPATEEQIDPEYRAWLDSLDIGSEVAIKVSLPWAPYERYVIREIKSIRGKTGALCIKEYPLCYSRKDGLSVITELHTRRDTRIEPITDRIREIVKHNQLVVRMRETIWYNAELSVLEQIKALLDEHNVPTNF